MIGDESDRCLGDVNDPKFVVGGGLADLALAGLLHQRGCSSTSSSS